MGRPYHEPLYLREERQAKGNRRSRGPGKTSDAMASKKVINDRLTQAKKDLVTWEGYQKRNEESYARDLKRVQEGTLAKCFLHKSDYSDTIKRLKARIVELTRILEAKSK